MRMKRQVLCLLLILLTTISALPLGGLTALADDESPGKAVEAVGAAAEDEVSAEPQVAVKISKRTDSGAELKNAQLRLTGTRSTGADITPIEWTTDGSVKTVYLYPGSYVLSETQSPAGFNFAEDIDFEITSNGKVLIGEQQTDSIIMIDYEVFGRVTVHKVDAEDLSRTLSGAEFKLYGTSDSGTAVNLTGTTGDDGTYVFEKVPMGTYQLEETKAPNGYNLDPENARTVVVDFQAGADTATVGTQAAGGTQAARMAAKAPAAVGAGANIASGTSGTCTWTIDGDGNLVIKPTSGTTGTLAEISALTDAPWNAYRDKITSVKFQGTVKTAANAQYLFQNCTNLKSVNVTGFDTSAATNLRNMFQGCTSLETLDLEQLVVSKNTQFVSMFQGCTSLKSVALSTWNTAKGTSFAYMFHNCQALKEVNVSNFNTAKATNLSYMFNWCCELEDLDVSNFDTSNVTTFYNLFNRCQKVKALDVKNFNTSKATNLQGIFNACYEITELDVSNFDTSKATNISYMFGNCLSLKNIAISHFNTSKATNMAYMFYNDYVLEEIDVSNFDTSNVLTIQNMFNGCRTLHELDLSNFDLTKATNTVNLVANCYNLQTLNLSNIKTPNNGGASNTYSLAFANLYNLKTLIAENSEIRSSWNKSAGDANRFPDGNWLYSGDGKTYSPRAINEKTAANNNFLPAGTYTKVASQSSGLENKPNTDYIIDDFSDFEITYTNPENFIRSGNVVYTKLINKPTTDSYTLPGSIILRLKDGALDVNKERHDVIITFDNITLKNDKNIAALPAQYHRKLLSVSPTANTFSLENWAYPTLTSAITNGKYGSYYDVNIKIVDDNDQPLDGTFLFYAADLDVANSSSKYAEGAEGVIFRDGCDMDTVTVADDTLTQWVNDHYIIGSKLDAGTMQSGFFIAGDATGMNFTWTSGTQCGTSFLGAGGKATVVDINKIADGEQLAGARLSLYREDGTLIQKWTTDGNTKSFILNTGIYTLKETFAPGGRYLAETIIFEVLGDGEISVNGYIQDEVTMVNNYVDLEYTFTDTRVKGEVSITKTDRDTGTPLEGVTFKLSGTSDIGEEVELTGVTNAEGDVVFENVLMGEYTLEEIPLKGYKGLAPRTVTVARTEHSKSVHLDLTNEILPLGKVKITKVDVTDPGKMILLSGAKFKLYGTSDDGDEIYREGVTGSNGVLNFDKLPLGTYTIEEMEAPYGYILDDTPRTVTLAERSDDTQNPSSVGPQADPLTVNLRLKAVRKAPASGEVGANIASGTSGTCTWTIDEGGNLVIKPTSGTTGTLANITTAANTPWNAYRDQIKSVKFEGTVKTAANAQYLFQNCTNLTSVDVTGFDTSAATNLRNMFYGCTALETLDLKQLNVSKNTQFVSMFQGCTKLKSLDISTWNTASATSFASLFQNCQVLESLDVSHFNTAKATSFGNMFVNCYLLEEIDVSGFDTAKATSLAGMFSGCRAVKNLDVSKFKTDNVTAFNSMFANCWTLEEIDVSGFNTAKAKSMASMFDNCRVLKKADVSGFNTDNVTTFASMFNCCYQLEEIDVSGFNTANATALNKMFDQCYVVKELDVSGFNTSKATNMASMFGNNRMLKTVDVSGFDTSNVTSMAYMFAQCWELENVDVSHFDTSNVTNMYQMFYNCYVLDEIDVSGFDTSKVTNFSSMFNGCYIVKELDVSNFDTSKATTLAAMFANCRLVEKLDVKNFKTSNVTAMNSMFQNCYVLKEADVSGFDTSKVTTFASMFNCCYVLEEIDVSNFDTSKATTLASMFANCRLVQKLDVKNFDTTNVTAMNSLFQNCYVVQALDVSGFDTSKVTNMNYMFSQCRLIKELDVSHFDTSKVNGMYALFNACYALEGVDTSDFDTSKVTNMSYMFAHCHVMKDIDVSSFDTSNVTNMAYMFNGAYALENLDITNFDTSKVTNMRNMFSNMYALGELDLSNLDMSAVTNVTEFLHLNTGIDKLTLGEAFTFSAEDTSFYLPYTVWVNTETGESFTRDALAAAYNAEMKGTYVRGSLEYMLPDGIAFNICLEALAGGDKANIKSFGRMETAPTAEQLESALDISAHGSNPIYFRFDEESGAVSWWADTDEIYMNPNSSEMFKGCSQITDISFDGINTSVVQDMSSMFMDCSSIKHLNLRSFDTSNVTTVADMFNNCKLLHELDMSDFDFGKVTNMNNMVWNCTGLEKINLSGVATPLVTSNCNIGLRTVHGLKTFIAEDSSIRFTNSATGVTGATFPDGTWRYSGNNEVYNVHDIMQDLVLPEEYDSLTRYLPAGTYTKVAVQSPGFDKKPNTDYVIDNLSDYVIEYMADDVYFDEDTLKFWVKVDPKDEKYNEATQNVECTLEGDLFTLRYKDAAVDANNERYDVIITIGDVECIHQYGDLVDPYNPYYKALMFLFPSTNNFQFDDNNYTELFGTTRATNTTVIGTNTNATVRIVDKNDNPVDGTFLFYCQDLDVTNKNNDHAEGCEGVIFKDGFDMDSITMADDTLLQWSWYYKDASTGKYTYYADAEALLTNPEYSQDAKGNICRGGEVVYYKQLRDGSDGLPPYIIGGMNDPETLMSGFFIAADASGMTYTWTSGRSCGTFFFGGGGVTVVDVEKVDEYGEPVPGAELELYKEDGTLVDAWTYDGTQKGFILNSGRYYLRETYAPEGRQYSHDIWFEVLADGSIAVSDAGENGSYSLTDKITMINQYVAVEVTVENQRKTGTINITKKDADTKNPISGVEFTLTGTSAISGRYNYVIGHSDIPKEEYPDYYFVDYYQTSDKLYKVHEFGEYTLDGDDVVNSQGQKVLDVNSEDVINHYWYGFERDMFGNFVDLKPYTLEINKTGTTDNNGALTFDNVPIGVYTLTETTPFGYLAIEPVTINVGTGDAQQEAEGVSISETDNGDGTYTYDIEIENKKQYELPETGGSGLIPLIIFSASMLLLSFGFYKFIYKKRKKLITAQKGG